MVAVSQTGETTLDAIVDKVIPPSTVEFLNTTLYRSPFLIFNYWSIVHFGAGMLFYLWRPNDFKLWIKINLIFEVVEFLLALGGNPLFVEEAIDIVWDIILSLSGFLFMRYLSRK